MAVEYEVRVRVGGKLGGIKAKPSDLSVDGPVRLTTLLPPTACDRDDAREPRCQQEEHSGGGGVVWWCGLVVLDMFVAVASDIIAIAIVVVTYGCGSLSPLLL